jgi:UDP-N-acetylmuramoyl-L-alanyl-D-glutamate--2,6-diaminopimelate ligase
VTAAPRRISELLSGIADTAGVGDIVVGGLTLDSRSVRAGDAFIALQGSTAHGITFAPAALAYGASIVVGEAPTPVALSSSLPPLAGEGVPRAEGGDISAPTIWIENLRAHVGEIAARFFGRPSESMHIIGVTGTNGKTSIVQLLAQALNSLHCKAATIGTLGAGLHGAINAGERTTPDAIRLQAVLAEFRDAGASHIAMEVSSHALDQGRVNAIAFEIAVFTNLTRDHLDYHGDMEAYGAAKARLFSRSGLRTAVVNIDDAFGRLLADGLPADVQALRYGIDNADADIVAMHVQSSTAGVEFSLRTPWGNGSISTALLGRFNVANLLAIAGCLGALGFTFPQIQNALSQLTPVIGRMNRLGGDLDLPLVVVDYAHTPDALEQALSSLRSHCDGRLVCIFGCGGDRDAGKRPQMGAVAERLADRIIVTDDNPRGEDGDVIVAQIVAGFSHPEKAVVQRDRAAAIGSALREAQAGDVVLIAGKGHEPYQEIRGVRHPFDDLDVARRLLEARAC